MKTSDQGRSPSSSGSVSGQKACGAPGDLKYSKGQFSVVGALPEEPTSGEMASPNFHNFPSYPNDLHERKTIKVGKGNVINIHFSDFELERPGTGVTVDYVEITDGDGTFLGRFGGEDYMDKGDNGSGSGEGSGEGSGDEQLSGYGSRLYWATYNDRNRIYDITSVTDTVHVLFHTDESDTYRGWRLEWSK